jgi:hypothetical protein
MLLGSTAIIFPAAARTGGVFTQLLLSIRAVSVPTLILLNTSIQILIVFGLPLLIAVHDIRTERKLHPATSVGLSTYYLVMLGAILLAFSVAGRALVRALE